jgi:2-methylcitrate dehydratase PrpD
MPFGAAVAVVHGDAFLDQYSMANINSEAIKNIMKKVTCLKNPLIEKGFPKKWPAHVEIISKDNRTFDVTIDHPKGDPENPLSWGEIIIKFRNLVAPVLSSSQQDTIITQVKDLENMTDLTRLMDTMTIDNFNIN